MKEVITEQFLARLDTLLEKVESWVPSLPEPTDWEATCAFRWRSGRNGGYLQPVRSPHEIPLDVLCGIEYQKRELVRNTEQFVRGFPANNALLWGARGTGKSSLIKAVLHQYAPQGLRLIEVDKHDLIDLPDITDPLYQRDERFILFSDDLSFETGDASYKALKAILDGSVSAPPDNVLIYATSNRRHLLPEYMKDNRDAQYVEGEVHQSEAVEEKISLSERFGLWLSFYPFKQDGYLEIVERWVLKMGYVPSDREALRADALRWALARGSHSGRSAYQFVCDWIGRDALEKSS